MSMIMGRDGRLVWDNFSIALKYWRIEWDKPDEGGKTGAVRRLSLRQIFVP